MTNQASMPKTIQAQFEEAEALHKQLYGEATPDTGNTAEPEPAPQPEPEPQPEPPAPAEPPPVVRKEDEETYQQRYRVLQSKYDAEVPRLHAQLREATGNIQVLAAELEKLKAAKPEPRTPEPPLVTDADKEAFGTDLVDLVKRGAQQAVAEAQRGWAEREQQLVEHIQQLEAQLGSVGQQVTESAQERFYAALGQAVPDYQAINVDPGFLTWLGEADPVYGVSRQVALNDAANRLDPQRVAAVFTAYKALMAKPAAPAKPPVNPELQRQVAPSAARSAPSAPSGERFWTAAEYTHAFDPRTIRELGQKKADELMAEADRAYQEGRVRF